MLDVFCYPNAIKAADGTLENFGTWRSFPAVLPVGTDLSFTAPAGWPHGPLTLLIEQYQLERNGAVLCRCSWGVRPDSPLKVESDLVTVERDFRAVGWIHMREAIED